MRASAETVAAPTAVAAPAGVGAEVREGEFVLTAEAQRLGDDLVRVFSLIATSWS